jgi:AcrR family transcriptional regulator
MMLFWLRGAEDASYNEIVAATQLSRKALYASWPDKNALVHETLATYREEVLGGLLGSLVPPSRKALIAFWDQLDAATREPSWSGCYLVRSASGPLRSDSVVQQLFSDYVGELQARIANAVRAGQQAGDIITAIDASAAGWQAVGINTLVSALGAAEGFSPRVAELLRIARAGCGVAD